MRPLLPTLAASVGPREFVQALLHAIGLRELKAGDRATAAAEGAEGAQGAEGAEGGGRAACFALGVRPVAHDAEPVEIGRVAIGVGASPLGLVIRLAVRDAPVQHVVRG